MILIFKNNWYTILNVKIGWGMNMVKILTENEEQTMNLAKKLTELLEPGMTLLLEGNLGAGKTTFTKGIGEGLGVKRIIKSPSYTIIREYQDGRLPLYHIDLYRLDESEASELGLEEYFEGNGITVVEWSSVAPAELPAERLEIRLKTDVNHFEQREIEINGVGSRYEELLKAFS